MIRVGVLATVFFFFLRGGMCIRGHTHVHLLGLQVETALQRRRSVQPEELFPEPHLSAMGPISFNFFLGVEPEYLGRILHN